MSPRAREIRPDASAMAMAEHVTSRHYEGVCECLHEVIWSFDNEPDVEELLKW